MLDSTNKPAMPDTTGATSESCLVLLSLSLTALQTEVCEPTAVSINKLALAYRHKRLDSDVIRYSVQPIAI